jgi:triosephosphate isomerase
MLADLGCRYVILGHSERRGAHKEPNELIGQKVAAGQLAGLTTIVCVGEKLEERVAGSPEEAVVKQLKESLPENCKPDQLVVAYEPVWAIGSGETPTVDEIISVNKAIRKAIGPLGEAIRILYGGSVTPKNAGEILSEPEIDGVLVGSASLSSDGFWGIAEKCL